MLKPMTTMLASLMMLATASHAQNAVDFREALRMTFPATVEVISDDTVDRRGPRNNRLQRFDMFGNLAAMSAPRLSAGFAISADRIIAQLDAGVQEVTVTTIDKTEHVGKVVARDHVTELCVVKVDDVELVSLVVGAAPAEPGLPVVVTWLEQGVARSHSGMIASSLNASQPKIGFTQHIDSAADLQSSGSPVVDATGVLVGITVVGADGAIVCMPSSQLNRLIDVSMEDSPADLQRGMAGIRFSTDVGPVISGVNDDSPAAEAGLQSGDLITQVDDFDVQSYNDVIAAVAMARSGDALQVTVERGEETIVRTLNLGDHPQQRKVTLSAVPDQGLQMRQQAWQLKDGKLVPMDLDQGGGVDLMLPEQFQEMFKGLQGGLQGGDLGLPRQFRMPRRFEGRPIERSDSEAALRELEAEKQEKEAKIKELNERIRELEGDK